MFWLISTESRFYLLCARFTARLSASCLIAKNPDRAIDPDARDFFNHRKCSRAWTCIIFIRNILCHVVAFEYGNVHYARYRFLLFFCLSLSLFLSATNKPLSGQILKSRTLVRPLNETEVERQRTFYPQSLSSRIACISTDFSNLFSLKGRSPTLREALQTLIFLARS